MISIIYSPRYAIDIGEHVFRTEKYRRVYERLVRDNRARLDVLTPDPVSWEQLALVHTSEYLTKVRDGTMTPGDVAALELPWSQEMVEGFRLMVGGTVLAARLACGIEARRSNSEVGSPSDASVHASEFRPVCHVGGGFHHAFANHGEGFCAFNDVAVATRLLQSRGVERVAVIDLDVHHGNGTAFIFESDPRVFTFSMHQQHNYPMWKPRGSLDIGLADGTGDATYLRALEQALPQVIGHQPQCVFYLAGADPFEDDQLGGLRLTKEGLRRRDRMVIETVRAARRPLIVTLAGGYARRVDDTVAIHLATIEETLGSTS